MKFPRSPHLASDPRLRLRYLSASVLALALFAGLASPANATIDNTATATGTPPSGPNVTDPSNTVQVPVAPADPQLVVTKSTAGPVDAVDIGVYDAGDTITYSVTVNNTGTITMYNTLPTDPGPLFNGVAGTGSWTGAFVPASATIAPGGSQIYSRTFTISNADAFRAAGLLNGVSNTSSATGNIGAPGGPVITGGDVTPGSTTTTIPATPRVDVAKAYTLTKGPGNLLVDAEEGDTINYSYTVQNTGNTTLTAVQISDDHENGGAGAVIVTPPTITGDNLDSDGPVGTSSDAATDGIYDTMRAGAQVSFTYAHTVTQPEFNDQ